MRGQEIRIIKTISNLDDNRNYYTSEYKIKINESSTLNFENVVDKNYILQISDDNEINNMAMYVEYSEEKLTLYACETTKRSRSQIAEQHGIELIERKPTKITPDALIAQLQPDLIIGDTRDIINYIMDI